MCVWGCWMLYIIVHFLLCENAHQRGLTNCLVEPPDAPPTIDTLSFQRIVNVESLATSLSQ